MHDDEVNNEGRKNGDDNGLKNSEISNEISSNRSELDDKENSKISTSYEVSDEKNEYFGISEAKNSDLKISTDLSSLENETNKLDNTIGENHNKITEKMSSNTGVESISDDQKDTESINIRNEDYLGSSKVNGRENDSSSTNTLIPDIKGNSEGSEIAINNSTCVRVKWGKVSSLG